MLIACKYLVNGQVFDSLESARAYANRFFVETGIIVAIESCEVEIV